MFFMGFRLCFSSLLFPFATLKLSLSSMFTFAARVGMAAYMKESVLGWYLDCVRHTCAPWRKEVPVTYRLGRWCLCVPDDSTTPNNTAMS